MAFRMKWNHVGKGKESQIFETIHGPLFVRTGIGAKYFTLLHAEEGSVFGDLADSWPDTVSDCTIGYIKYVLGVIIIKSAKEKQNGL